MPEAGWEFAGWLKDRGSTELRDFPLAAAADPRPWGSPMGAFRFCLGLWVFQPAGPLVRDRRRLEVVRKSLRPAASTRSQTARCSPVDPTGRAPVHHSPRFREEFRCQKVRQRGESHRAIQFGLLRYLTQLR